MKYTKKLMVVPYVAPTPTGNVTQLDNTMSKTLQKRKYSSEKIKEYNQNLSKLRELNDNNTNQPTLSLPDNVEIEQPVDANVLEQLDKKAAQVEAAKKIQDYSLSNSVNKKIKYKDNKLIDILNTLHENQTYLNNLYYHTIQNSASSNQPTNNDILWSYSNLRDVNETHNSPVNESHNSPVNHALHEQLNQTKQLLETLNNTLNSSKFNSTALTNNVTRRVKKPRYSAIRKANLNKSSINLSANDDDEYLTDYEEEILNLTNTNEKEVVNNEDNANQTNDITMLSESDIQPETSPKRSPTIVQRSPQQTSPKSPTNTNQRTVLFDTLPKLLTPQAIFQPRSPGAQPRASILKNNTFALSDPDEINKSFQQHLNILPALNAKLQSLVENSKALKISTSDESPKQKSAHSKKTKSKKSTHKQIQDRLNKSRIHLRPRKQIDYAE